jgi:hypothetical protein
MESEFISILIGYYQEISNSKASFDGSYFFDQKCGISYVGMDEISKDHFKFRITDEQKYFLAKIKYGI